MIFMKTVLKAGVMIADISDHLPVFYVSKNSEDDLTSQLKTGSANLTFRHITEKGLANMISEAAEVDWSDVCNSVDVNEAYGLFSDKLLNIL